MKCSTRSTDFNTSIDQWLQLMGKRIAKKCELISRRNEKRTLNEYFNSPKFQREIRVNGKYNQKFNKMRLKSLSKKSFCLKKFHHFTDLQNLIRITNCKMQRSIDRKIAIMPPHKSQIHFINFSNGNNIFANGML